MRNKVSGKSAFLHRAQRCSAKALSWVFSLVEGYFHPLPFDGPVLSTLPRCCESYKGGGIYWRRPHMFATRLLYVREMSISSLTGLYIAPPLHTSLCIKHAPTPNVLAESGARASEPHTHPKNFPGVLMLMITLNIVSYMTPQYCRALSFQHMEKSKTSRCTPASPKIRYLAPHPKTIKLYYGAKRNDLYTRYFLPLGAFPLHWAHARGAQISKTNAPPKRQEYTRSLSPLTYPRAFRQHEGNAKGHMPPRVN